MMAEEIADACNAAMKIQETFVPFGHGNMTVYNNSAFDLRGPTPDLPKPRRFRRGFKGW
jgi:hypothetical protein